jgi:hypothetical protein
MILLLPILIIFLTAICSEEKWFFNAIFLDEKSSNMNVVVALINKAGDVVEVGE